MPRSTAARFLLLATWYLAAGYRSAAAWWVDQAFDELAAATDTARA